MEAIAQAGPHEVGHEAGTGRGIEGKAAPVGLAPLATYTGSEGRRREVVARRAAHGLLVIDREAGTLDDRRLVAHLDADEPAGNAALVAQLFAADEAGRFCRELTDADWFERPGSIRDSEPEAVVEATPSGGGSDDPPELIDAAGFRYCVEMAGPRDSHHGPQLRWRRRPPTGGGGQVVSVSVRCVVGAVEAYEPACSMTRRAIQAGPAGAVQVLRRELHVLEHSPYVLNRGLREAALAAVAAGETWSTIALRSMAPRVRRRGVGGDTSWLARRLGLKGESRGLAPTPWIHADVLARIARDGLGIDPRDVELA